MPIAGIYGPEDFARPRREAPSARPARTLATPPLDWTPEVERATAHLYEKVKTVIPPVEWPLMARFPGITGKFASTSAGSSWVT